MRKVHVITQKEAVDVQKIEGCTVVVLDVFLATSTITFLIDKNYCPVYAVENSVSGLLLSKEIDEPYILLGESKGDAIEGFQYPDPSLVVHSETKKSAIICSTNGTRAIKKAENAKKLIISSLINGHKVADFLHEQEDDSSIVIICSGNDNRFSMEDFIGAGHVIYHLMNKGDYLLSDSSKLAREAFVHALSQKFEGLLTSETAHLLDSLGYGTSISYVLNHFEKVDVVPILEGNKIVAHSTEAIILKEGTIVQS
ncbi:2-phosphosulfolactate phosphatase [Psychrobacillus sp. OK028]|uniref:2-phosphosulfolactate phosphatase n=1 Tax=Psychrobacillus sp. OK028 TaxID=1884359 RepID=UPI000891019D|nr:2-phosphosulfolactate phosphatase [Psychrobacillus sp. OK028]SDM40243.1 2-phosphosulfolactate phosphatase [Psychrobacillus sp. OK028]